MTENPLKVEKTIDIFIKVCSFARKMFIFVFGIDLISILCYLKIEKLYY